MPRKAAVAVSQATLALSDQSEQTTDREETNVCELEREREELMRRNQEMLSKLGVTNAVAALRRKAAAPPVPVSGAAQEDGSGSSTAAAERRLAPRPKRVKVEVEIVKRRSSRLAGTAAEGGKEDGAGAAAELPPDSPKATGRGIGIMTQEEYLKSKGLPLPEGSFRTDGRFRGWVARPVVERFGLAGSAAEAWERGGGGEFKRKIKKSDVPAHLRNSGWSDARAFAAGQLHKNPNAYFYRHTAPGQAQAQGEWTEEEHELFMKTAREHGVGDKWGLFASYIPNRVGYQCSAYYTQVIIPSGLILDSRFRMDAWGDAVFVGAKGQAD